MSDAGGLLGAKHPELQTLRRLSGRRNTRRDLGRFVIDGPLLVADALDAGLPLDTAYAEPTAPAEVVAAARSAGVRVRRVGPGVLAKVTSPVTPQPIAATAPIPVPGELPATGCVLVLVDVGDPGNAGTLLRIAEAAGCPAVVFTGDAVDPWNPKCVRASAGSVFRIPVHVEPRPADAVTALRSAGLRIVATAGDGGADPASLALADPVAVLLGSEAHGLRPELIAAADRVATIPMAGRIESLNVAMAGCVLAFEAASQRRRVASNVSTTQGPAGPSSGSPTAEGEGPPSN